MQIFALQTDKKGPKVVVQLEHPNWRHLPYSDNCLSSDNLSLFETAHVSMGVDMGWNENFCLMIGKGGPCSPAKHADISYTELDRASWGFIEVGA